MGSTSQWARETFGDLADDLTDIIPDSLLRAHDRARNGHEGVHTQTLEAYGHGLYAVQYEELAVGLEALGEPVRLQGRTIMIVRGHVIYPFRYAKKDVPVTTARLRRATGLRADLIRRHGPEPMQQTLDLPCPRAPADAGRRSGSPKPGDRMKKTPHPAERWRRGLPALLAKCPRQDSNLRTRLRRPLLYPLSYGGVSAGSRFRSRRRVEHYQLPEGVLQP